MDEPWMIERLEWWIETARESRSRSERGRTGFTNERSALYSQLREASPQIHAIISRVLNSNEVPSLMRRQNSVYWVDQGIEYAEHAVAVLRTRDETAARLGNSAPTMKADQLHPLIWEAASKRWDAGHYSDAVQRAATFLNANVQDITGRRDVSDAELMREVFSMNSPSAGRPRLWWPGYDSDLTVKSMRVGILNMSQGVFSAIRNPATHSTEDMARQEALEQLATLSILARWIDRCELLTE